jgi:hypothetical protein
MEDGDKNCGYKNSYSNWWEDFELQMFEVLEYKGGFLIKKANSQSQIYSNVSKLSTFLAFLFIHVLPSRSISTMLIDTAYKGLRLQNSSS